jgi:hypothetical protein
VKDENESRDREGKEINRQKEMQGNAVIRNGDLNRERRKKMSVRKKIRRGKEEEKSASMIILIVIMSE